MKHVTPPLPTLVLALLLFLCPLTACNQEPQYYPISDPAPKSNLVIESFDATGSVYTYDQNGKHYKVVEHADTQPNRTHIHSYFYVLDQGSGEYELVDDVEIIIEMDYENGVMITYSIRDGKTTMTTSPLGGSDASSGSAS